MEIKINDKLNNLDFIIYKNGVLDLTKIKEKNNLYIKILSDIKNKLEIKKIILPCVKNLTIDFSDFNGNFVDIEFFDKRKNNYKTIYIKYY